MTANGEIDIRLLLSIMKRNGRFIGRITGGFVLAALLYLLITPTKYTASATLFLDRGVTATEGEISAGRQNGGADFEKSAIDSEVEIIQSDRVTAAAIERLKKKGYFKDKGTDPESMQKLIDDVSDDLKVSRVSETYVLSVAYSAKTKQEAADFANAYADAYIAEQLDALSQTSSRAVDWLQTKTDELNKQATDARKVAAEYRTRYNKAQRDRLDASNDAKEPASPADVTAAPVPAPAAGPAPTEETGLNELRNIEQQADTYNTLYDSYLQKLKTINLQGSFPLTKTRVISPAVPPLHKSHPRSLMILAVAIVFGLGTGAFVTLLRENFDRTLKRAGQVRSETGLAFLGFLPDRALATRKAIPFLSADGGRYVVPFSSDSVDSPYSLYAEVCRTLINAVDHHAGATTKKVVSIVTDDAKEAKTLLALNLAAYAAQSAPTLLIDADMRAPGFFFVAPAPVRKTLGDVLRGDATLAEACVKAEGSGLSVLPCGGAWPEKGLPYLTLARVQSLIAECKTRYDYIVVNLPPMITPADAFAFEEVTDCFVVAGEWGRTQPAALNFHLAHNAVPREKIVGLVLENADMGRMEKHYGHKAQA